LPLDLRVDHRLRVRLPPSGEALGCGLYVVLAERVRAHREELHQLARIVLVRALSGGRAEVEVAQHAWVDRDLLHHRAKVAEGVPTPREVLPVDERRLRRDLAE